MNTTRLLLYLYLLTCTRGYSLSTEYRSNAHPCPGIPTYSIIYVDLLGSQTPSWVRMTHGHISPDSRFTDPVGVFFIRRVGITICYIPGSKDLVKRGSW